MDAADILAQSRRLLVFTGAGISTEAGIPDFRSPDGLWTRLDPSKFSLENFLRDPVEYWKLRADLMRELDLERRAPTAAHAAIAAHAATGRLLGVVTQNIDGLHERAGTPEHLLARLHGSAWEVTCIGCRRRFPFEVARRAVEAQRLPPTCGECGGVLKPGTVLFGEEMPREPLERAYAWARACDACLVVGSSLSVWPASAVPEIALERGARLVIVNRAATLLDEEADAVVRDAASVAVPRLLPPPA